MKRLFLASSVDVVASDIARHLRAGLKLVFITTPAEGEDGDKQWLENDRSALVKAGFAVSDYTITGKTGEEVKNEEKGSGTFSQFYLYLGKMYLTPFPQPRSIRLTPTYQTT